MISNGATRNQQHEDMEHTEQQARRADRLEVPLSAHPLRRAAFGPLRTVVPASVSRLFACSPARLLACSPTGPHRQAFGLSSP